MVDTRLVSRLASYMRYCLWSSAHPPTTYIWSSYLVSQFLWSMIHTDVGKVLFFGGWWVSGKKIWGGTFPVLIYLVSIWRQYTFLVDLALIWIPFNDIFRCTGAIPVSIYPAISLGLCTYTLPYPLAYALWCQAVMHLLGKHSPTKTDEFGKGIDIWISAMIVQQPPGICPVHMPCQ